jgi:hypothetical protein
VITQDRNKAREKAKAQVNKSKMKRNKERAY